MKIKTNIKDNCFIIIIAILMISFTVNIYQSILNKKYLYEIGKENYSKIEEIRFRNESILSILDSCVTAESVNNVDLLTLYKNYSKISEAEISLWNNYLTDDNKTLGKLKNKGKNIVVNTRTKNELYSEIEDLIYSYIQNDMTEKIDFIELKGKVADDFKTLRSMALDLNNYFNSFYEENCNVSEDKKEKLKALLDTGNMLKDPLSNKPVMIATKRSLKSIIPEEILDNINLILGGDKIGKLITKRIKLIPFNSLGNEHGILIGIKSDKIIINNNEIKDVIIGIYEKEFSKTRRYDALIGIDLLYEEECNYESNRKIKK